MAQPSDSRVRPDDLAGSWEAYPRDRLGQAHPTMRHTLIPDRRAHDDRRYRWEDHRRRLYWRALMNVVGVLRWILIALLWLVQWQAGR